MANNAVKSVRICPGDFHGAWSVITLFWELNIPVAAAGLLLWARWPRDIGRLLQKWQVNVCSATLSAYVGS